MKRLLILTAILSICINLKADNLTIVHQDWTKAQEIAKRENKLILIDYYTSWCSSCKAFSKSLEEDEQIQDRLANDFVILKYNAEEDNTYHLSKKFHVRSYPTFVAVKPNMQYIDRMSSQALGNLESKYRFLKFARTVEKMNRTKAFPTGYNFRTDNEYPDFYAKAISNKWKYNQADVDRYWQNTNDYSSEVSFAVYSVLGAPPVVDAYFLKHKPIFDEKFGKSATKVIIENMSNIKLSEALKIRDGKKFQEALIFATKYSDSTSMNKALPVIEIKKAVAQEDCNQVSSILNRLVRSKLKLSPAEVNSVCWEVYKSKCKNTALLTKAELLMKDILTSEQNYYYLDTYACLLYKNGKYNDARLTMNRAIEYAMKDQIDFKGSSDILKLIEEKKGGNNTD